MTEDPIEPLLSHDEPGPRFKAKDIAKIIADGGVEYPTAAARVANYAKGGLIQVREKAANGTVKSANLYAFADVCAALLLSNFQDCGIGDHEILQYASVAMYYTGVPKIPGKSPHAIARAAEDTFIGDPWMLQLDIYRSDNADFRKMNRAFYRLGDEPVWTGKRMQDDPDWELVVTLMINTGSLARLQRFVHVDPKAN